MSNNFEQKAITAMVARMQQRALKNPNARLYWEKKIADCRKLSVSRPSRHDDPVHLPRIASGRPYAEDPWPIALPMGTIIEAGCDVYGMVGSRIVQTAPVDYFGDFWTHGEFKWTQRRIKYNVPFDLRPHELQVKVEALGHRAMSPEENREWVILINLFRTDWVSDSVAEMLASEFVGKLKLAAKLNFGTEIRKIGGTNVVFEIRRPVCKKISNEFNEFIFPNGD